MNQTDDVSQYSNDQDVSLLSAFTALFSTIALLLCMMLYYPVFPIFIYVFRKNRDNEKESNVFPILQHFYRTTIFEYLFISSMFIALFFQHLHPEYIIKYSNFFLILSLRYDIFIVFFEIHHLIIILLAVQRFVLYFELRIKVDFSPKATNIILFMLYFMEYLKLTVFEISIAYFENQTMHFIYLKMVLYENIIIHVLLFVSASLYIPISVSLRRKAHLRSIIKNKPHRFILYQTIGLAAFKFASLRMHIYNEFEDDNRQISVFNYGNKFDFFTTPVMIQMSYLFSNKRNLDTIKNIFKRNNRTTPYRSNDVVRASSLDN